MAGNRNSGRRRSVETLLRDAGMDARLVQEACRAAAAGHRDLGRTLLSIHEQAQQNQRSIDDALAELRRTRVIHAVPAVTAGGALPEAA